MFPCRPLILLALLIGMLHCLGLGGSKSLASTAPHAIADDWAYQPLKRPTVPQPRLALSNPIDAFIRARLEESRIAPSSETDKRTLLRRVYFDLIGLPPAPEEMRAFLSDDSPDAYERVVDRLLATPRYGERWTRLWMDTAHFAETHGHDQDRIR